MSMTWASVAHVAAAETAADTTYMVLAEIVRADGCARRITGVALDGPAN